MVDHEDTERGPLTFAQMLDVLNGEPPHDPHERARQRAAAARLEGLPISQWPPFEVKWDLSQAGQKWALDGVRQQEFEKSYRRGRNAALWGKSGVHRQADRP